MTRFRMLSDAQWSMIEEMLPRPTGRKGRPFSDARLMVEGIIYRYRCGIRHRMTTPQRPDTLVGAAAPGRTRPVRRIPLTRR